MSTNVIFKEYFLKDRKTNQLSFHFFNGKYVSYGPTEKFSKHQKNVKLGFLWIIFEKGPTGPQRRIWKEYFPEIQKRHKHGYLK